MKHQFLILIAAIFLAGCSAKPINGNCYKARLEIKGICSNYTIKIMEGSMDTSTVSANWKDEQTGKNYTNVFALGNPCSFPADIAEGQEFYFTIDSAPRQDCSVCMAYYPKPPKAMNIRVVSSPCK